MYHIKGEKNKMRNLYEYAKMCMEKLDRLGIAYSKNIQWEINTRAKKRWGQCEAILNGCIISINHVLLDEQNNDVGLINTIIHELLHSVEGCMNHGAKWKALAEKVNAAYGYNIKRTSTADEKGVLEESIMKEGINKYRIICLKCGKCTYRTRACIITKHPDRYYHKCGGELIVERI